MSHKWDAPFFGGAGNLASHCTGFPHWRRRILTLLLAKSRTKPPIRRPASVAAPPSMAPVRAFLKVASPLWDRKRREKKKHSFECERFFAFMIPPQHKVRAVNKVIDEMGLLEKVKVEWGLLCMAHNISKLANIQWV